MITESLTPGVCVNHRCGFSSVLSTQSFDYYRNIQTSGVENITGVILSVVSSKRVLLINETLTPGVCKTLHLPGV